MQRMIDGAERLGAGFDFVRVDFYDVGAVPRFGEMTFYPGSGLDPFDPLTLDRLLGDCWRGLILKPPQPATGWPVSSPARPGSSRATPATDDKLAVSRMSRTDNS